MFIFTETLKLNDTLQNEVIKIHKQPKNKNLKNI